MSRKYCTVCDSSHNNGILGLCDTHLVTKEMKEIEERDQIESDFKSFMIHDEEYRWRLLWEAAGRPTY